MRVQALNATQENVVNTLLDDRIGRLNDVCSFVSIISNIDGSCSIGLDGKWGTGKTFFVKQAKLIIDSLNPNTPSNELTEKIANIFKNTVGDKAADYPPLVTAYYDAWQHDNEDEPILSLMYEIMSDNYNGYSVEKRKSWSDILASIATVISKRDVVELVKYVKGKDPFEKQKENKDIFDLVKEFLASFLPERGNKLVIFIDELDRCSPLFAVKLLERIKHYFSCDDIVFVFSINFNELQNSVRNLYGERFDSCRYMDRFFDFRIELPEVDTNRYIESIGHSTRSNMRETACVEIIRQMNMGMREISRFLQMSKSATFEYTDGDAYQRGKLWSHDDGISDLISLCIIVPIVIGLRMTDAPACDDFIEGRDSSWLERIIQADSLCDWVTRFLLTSDETYVKEEGKKAVTQSQKIRDMYTAIFVKSYEGAGEYQTQVGRCIFDKDTKKRILKAISFTSPYSSFE